MRTHIETKHTMGPWHIGYYGEMERPIIKRGALSLAEILSLSDGPKSRAQVEANARLIASAPDLLAALKETHGALVAALQVLAECDAIKADDLKSVPDGGGYRARAVISKAEGTT